MKPPMTSRARSLPVLPLTMGTAAWLCGAGLFPTPVQAARDGDGVYSRQGLRRRREAVSLPLLADVVPCRCGGQQRGDASRHRVQQGRALERCETLI
jgi:hypothetical protein